jgi:fructose-specific phosphotransferase system IIC component
VISLTSLLGVAETANNWVQRERVLGGMVPPLDNAVAMLIAKKNHSRRISGHAGCSLALLL